MGWVYKWTGATTAAIYKKSTACGICGVIYCHNLLQFSEFREAFCIAGLCPRATERGQNDRSKETDNSYYHEEFYEGKARAACRGIVHPEIVKHATPSTRTLSARTGDTDQLKRQDRAGVAEESCEQNRENPQLRLGIFS